MIITDGELPTRRPIYTFIYEVLSLAMIMAFIIFCCLYLENSRRFHGTCEKEIVYIVAPDTGNDSGIIQMKTYLLSKNRLDCWPMKLALQLLTWVNSEYIFN